MNYTSLTVRKRLLAKFNHRCGYCFIRLNLCKRDGGACMTVDHFIPKKQLAGVDDDALNDFNNLIAACPSCNSAKYGRYFDSLVEARRWISLKRGVYCINPDVIAPSID